MDITPEEEMKIAEDFRRQLQERFPSYVGDRDEIDVANSIRSNRAKLESSIAAPGSSFEEEFLDDILSELEGTPLPNPRDEPLTHSIMRTICGEVEAACRDLGIPLRGGIAHGVSPTLEINAEQHSVPTTETSVVELSFGFISFCSHLSKVLSQSLPHKDFGDSVQVGYDSSEILKKIGSESELKLLWLELFGAYAYGDGPLNIDWRIVPYPQSLTRNMLLFAFERFAVAHEYAHHIEEHGKMDTVGAGGDPESQDQEIEADMFAIALCRYMEGSKEHPNAFLVSGAAPALLLKCLDYVRRTRKIFAGGRADLAESSGTHPETDERILAFDSYIDGLSPQQVSGFQRLRQDLCSVVDAVWNRLRPLFINMYDHGLRVEESPISWLPGSGSRQ